MCACAFQFAEGDGGDQSVAVPGGGFIGTGREELPQPSTVVRADLGGIFPEDTVQTLSGEAASGRGAEIFAAEAPSSSNALFLILAAAGLYLATRNT